MSPGMGHNKRWWSMYEELRAKGYTKSSAARITNSKMPGKKKKRKKRR